MPTTKIKQSYSASGVLIENNNNNNNDDSQARVTLLEQHHIKPQHHAIKTINNPLSTVSMADQTPSNLLELKQQRLLAAADRKKRLITRLISIVGILIILLCAIIVTLTLKMAPKIDELVRTKTGSHSPIHLLSRMTTLSTTITIELNNSTTNHSLIIKSIFHT